MPQRDCPIILNGCPGVDAPITNISAEAADTFQWSAQIWSPWDPYRPPRLGDGQQVKVDCSALASDVFSNFNPIVFSESQAMANIIALGQSLGCPWNIPEVSGILLQNDAQSATVTCPDGSSFTVEIPAGTYQIDAAILCGYPTDTVTFVKSGSANVVVTHTGCFVQFTQDELLGSQLNTATWLCIDGHTFTQSIPGGYVSSAAIACEAWLDQANDWALAEAQSQATAMLDCVTKDDPTGPGDTPPTVFPGPGIFTNPTWTCLGEEFFSSYNIGGRGSSAYTLEIISGTIPPGLVFTQTNPRRATLSGFTTTAGAYTFTIKATSTALPFSVIQAVDTVFVFGLVSDTLPSATLGVLYSDTLSADGGTAPYTFALDPDSDPLPDGLTLASDGTISGTPTTPGDFTFDVVVTDSTGGECAQTVMLSVSSVCSADTECPTVPLASYLCVIPDSAYISDWNARKTELIAPTADPAGIQPEWDGTFPLLDLATFPGVAEWIPAGSVPPVYASYALNGLKGTLLIIEQTGGGIDWLLFLRGSVSGVNTVIWQGTKTVGNTPIGTYMRTGGLSSGPACFHVEAPEVPIAAAWWKMETSPNVVDAACGNILVGSNPLWISNVAGKVTNALRLHCEGFNDTYSSLLSQALSPTSSGITIVGWVRSTYNIAAVGSNREQITYAFYVGASVHNIDIRHFQGGNWAATLDGAGSISKPFSAGWHFFVVQYDPVTGTLGFDIDQSGITTSLVATLSPTISPNTSFLIGSNTGASGVGNMDTDFDEVAIYKGLLTTAQLDCLYNAGTGLTW